MSKFLCKAILFGGFRVGTLAPTIDLCVLRNPNAGPLRWLSMSSKERSFTVSYLIDSLGLSPKAAISASKMTAFETSAKPDKVVRLLEGYGFGRTQISTLARSRPSLLVADSEKTILPKLEFFKAKGVSWPEFAKKVSVYPTVLHSSLDEQIIPAYEFFRDFFGSDEKVILAIKRYPNILTRDVEKCVKPMIGTLREHGVPDPNIAALLLYSPCLVVISSDRLRKLVEEVTEMGFSASSQTFVAAVSALASMSKSTWESKVNAYKKWGWTEEDVLRAFRSCPWCMKISIDKITEGMDFYINKIGFSPDYIVNYPTALCFSLKKRLIPRYLVFQALRSKGLMNKEFSLYTLFGTSEKYFLRKFVVRYEREVPELLKLYNENLDRSSGPGVENV